jgi:hypothetical protein
MRPSFSLGIEEEYQTIDPVTRDLRSHIQTEMLEQGKLRLQERVKAEMHTSVIEVGTRVCRNIDEARDDIYELRREMIKLARENGLVLVAGATHPFADWRKQGIYPDPRQPDLRAACARGHRGPGSGHPHHEFDSLLSASHHGPRYEFAVLAGAEHGLQGLPRQGVREFSADGDSGRLPKLLGV